MDEEVEEDEDVEGEAGSNSSALTNTFADAFARPVASIHTMGDAKVRGRQRLRLNMESTIV